MLPPVSLVIVALAAVDVSGNPSDARNVSPKIVRPLLVLLTVAVPALTVPPLQAPQTVVLPPLLVI